MKYLAIFSLFLVSCTSADSYAGKLDQAYDEVSKKLCDCVTTNASNLFDQKEDRCEETAQTLFAKAMQDNGIDPKTKKAIDLFAAEIAGDRLYKNCKGYQQQLDVFFQQQDSIQ